MDQAEQSDQIKLEAPTTTQPETTRQKIANRLRKFFNRDQSARQTLHSLAEQKTSTVGDPAEQPKPVKKASGSKLARAAQVAAFSARLAIGPGDDILAATLPALGIGDNAEKHLIVPANADKPGLNLEVSRLAAGSSPPNNDSDSKDQFVVDPKVEKQKYLTRQETKNARGFRPTIVQSNLSNRPLSTPARR